tara:strand:- start:3491 stop:5848 length:2358 start_codon:yes stop_codon:yes gene_type:complete
MGSNKKISDLENNESTWAIPPINGKIAVYNILTKELKHVSMETLHSSFGVDGHKFIVGNYATGVTPTHKFTVYGDSELVGSLKVDSAYVGSAPSGSFTGFYLDSSLYTQSIKNVDSPTTRIDFSASGIDFYIQNQNFLSIESGIATMNKSLDSNFVFKASSNRLDTVNNTALFIDTSSGGGVGVGTDDLSADFQVEGKRIIFGAELGGVLRSDKSLGGFSALGGQSNEDLAVAFQSGIADGYMSFATQKGHAVGRLSFADGDGTLATGDYSAAHNKDTIAEGDYSHAEGFQTQAIGIASHSEGADTIAKGDYSHAEGSGTHSSGIASHAEGLLTLAQGSYTHAEGERTKAVGYASHAEGYLSEAHGSGSHAEGYETFSSGETSHTQGFQTRVIGDYSSANGYKSLVTGDHSYAQGRECKVVGDSAQAEGLNSQALVSQSFAIGVDAIAKQTAEHARSAGRNVGTEKSQISRYFGLDHQSGYSPYVKYPLTLGNQGDNILLDAGGVYNLDVSIVGRGRMLHTARVAGDTVNWNYRLKGSLAIHQVSGSGDYVSSFTTPPHIYTTPMSALWGGVIPVNDWTPIEPYIVTDLEVVSTPNQYSEIPGFTPYVEFLETGVKSGQLEIGICRSHDWAYYEIGSIFAGNSNGTAQYTIYPSVIFSGKNSVEEDLTFLDVSGVFAKDTGYFDLEYSGYVLDTGSYDVYNVTGVGLGAGLGSIIPGGIQIDHSGAASLGESDLTTLVPPIVGFSGICYGNISLDCEIFWHSVTDLNTLVSQISTETGSDIIINC